MQHYCNVSIMSCSVGMSEIYKLFNVCAVMKAGPTTVGEITGADEDKRAGSLAGKTVGEAMGAVDNMTAV